MTLGEIDMATPSFLSAADRELSNACYLQGNPAAKPIAHNVSSFDA